MTRSTASKVLTLMERKGFIQRQNVARDARLKKIVLTQKALKISERMARETDRFEEKLTAGFTEEELDRLFRYLRRMKDNIRDL
jgi:DNA-binding MarR family transcriptional regulator